MKSFTTLLFVAIALVARGASAQVSYAGQWPSTWDIVAGPAFVRANAGPGNCGCFLMNGVAVQFAITRGSGLGALVDYATTSVTNINNSTHNVALSTYMGGVRYRLHPRKRLAPYVQGLAGISHASTNFLVDNGATGIAYAGGGGLDYALSRRLSLRLFEADYLVTHVPNGLDNQQNQVRLTLGIVFHLYKPGF